MLPKDFVEAVAKQIKLKPKNIHKLTQFVSEKFSEDALEDLLLYLFVKI